MSKSYVKPSIVAPGGNIEKAIIALDYGADAVYVGTPNFSLRKSADNLTITELSYLCDYAKKINKKVYLAMNIFPNQTDMDHIRKFFNDINSINISALIISDIGLCNLAKEETNFPIHVSTQASVLNTASAYLWKSLGAKRIVLAREASLEESYQIKKHTSLETEVFIHGAMCSSFSGKCTISSVSSGRDSNRGGCVQSCRHNYELSNNDSLHIMNSKDLMGIELIPLYFKYHVDAIKIEGRMKSALYIANAVQQYRTAIDLYATNQNQYKQKLALYIKNLQRISNRGFTTASLNSPANDTSISYKWNGYNKSAQFVGIAKKYEGNKTLIKLKTPINHGDKIQYISPKSKTTKTIIFQCLSGAGEVVDSLRPNECGWFKGHIPKHSILFKTHD